MSRGLPPFKMLTVRAGDITDGDVVELPDLVYVWKDPGTRWIGKDAEIEPRLRTPRWHHVYDAFDRSDMDVINKTSGGDVLLMLDALSERHVMLLIGTEAPNDAGHMCGWVALHELELVRVQRPVAESTTGPDQADASLLRRAVPMLVRLGDFIGNGELDPDREESLGARCDLLLDIAARLQR